MRGADWIIVILGRHTLEDYPDFLDLDTRGDPLSGRREALRAL